MDKELDRIRKQNRWVFIALLIVGLLVVVGFLISSKEKQPPVVKNYVGQQGQAGQNGESIEGPQGPAGYSPIKGVDYFDGIQGVPGAVGPIGPQSTIPGPQGPPGQTIQGPAGDPGQDGKSPEFQCSTEHDYQWRYVGDEDWQTLQINSLVCQSAS